MSPDTLHWLRPEWAWLALLLLPALPLLWRGAGERRWRNLIDPELLPELELGASGRRLGMWWGLPAIALLALALAGPSWEQRPVPAGKNSDALVILLDLSRSMLAEDMEPSRLARARYAIADILDGRQSGQTALVAYAGDAFTVTPLTDDAATLQNLLPRLHPDIMPVQGNNPAAAFRLAADLLEGAGVRAGAILWVTDGIRPEQVSGLRALREQRRDTLAVLAVGSRGGAPIPLPKGGFLRDGEKIVLAKLDPGPLKSILKAGDPGYRPLRADDTGLPAWLNATPQALEDSDRQLEQWVDGGWLPLLLLLFPVALLFRRGVLLSLLPLALIPVETAEALEWQDLWQRPDQQGYDAMRAEDYDAARQRFEDPAWQAAAAYRAGDHAAAAQLFNGINSRDAHFNRGNALAHAGELAAAIEAYDQALALDALDHEARRNREIVEQLLEQQQQNEQQSGDPSENDEQEDGEQQDSESSEGENQSNGEQQTSDNSEQQKEQDQQDESRAAESGQSGSAAEEESQQQSPAENREAEAQEREMAEQHFQPGEEQGDTGDEQRQQAAVSTDMMDEQQQAVEQWLRQIPDNPGSLLRRKFESQYLQRQEKNQLPEASEVAPW